MSNLYLFYIIKKKNVANGEDIYVSIFQWIISKKWSNAWTIDLIYVTMMSTSEEKKLNNERFEHRNHITAW